MASAGEKALHAALKKRVFDPVYFFFGEDDFLKDARMRELVDVAVDPVTRDFNLEVRRGNELDTETLDSLLSTPPMLAERRVVVVRDVDKLKKDARTLLMRYLEQPAADKGRLPGQQLVEHHAQAIDIATAIDRVAFSGGLFRAHVGRRADDLALCCHDDLCLIAQGQPEIHDNRPTQSSLRFGSRACPRRREGTRSISR